MRRSGSITSYVFGAFDCSCSRSTDLAGANASNGALADESGFDFCPKCGLGKKGQSKAGSLTGFLFQNTSCKCPPEQAFADGKMSARFWKLRQTGSGTIFSPAAAEQSKKDHAAIVIDLLPGAIIGGAYEIVSLLGRGGMGEVYLARHNTLGKKCALKVIPPDQVTEIGWQRFQLEARAVAKLEHINLVRVTDLGIHEGCLPFYAMDFVDGKNLAEILAEQGRMPLSMVLEIFTQVCDGVEFAHRGGILHRDLKPANIMLTASGTGVKQAKVLDFGLAKLTGHDRDKQSLTAIGDVFGSPFYMSPEQCNGERLDDRSDIYSLGCTMFECLTGRPPFTGHLAAAVIFGHLEADPPSLESVVGPRVFPDSLEIVMAKLLRKNPVERYQTLLEVRSDLVKVLQGEEVLPVYMSRSAHKPANTHKSIGADDSVQPSRSVPVAPFVVAFLSISALLLTGAVVLINDHAFKMIPSKAKAIPKQSRDPVFFNSKVAEDIVQTDRAMAQAKPVKVNSFLYAIDINPHQLRYKFPTDQSLGRLEWLFFGPDGKAQTGHCEARGFVSIPAGALLSIQPGAALLTQPELFNGFGPNDLDGIFLYSPYEWNDKHIAAISRLTGLKSLTLNHAFVTDNSIDDLNKILELTHLRAENTGWTGQGLSKLKTLPELESLIYSGQGGVSFMKRMANSKLLKELKLESCNLLDADMKIISTIPNLTILDLSRNPELTDRGISCLEGLKNLRELYIDSTGVSPACIKTLKYLPLRILKIDIANWTREQVIMLESAIPGCHIRKVGVSLSKTLVPTAKQSSGGKKVKQQDEVFLPEWRQFVREHD